MNERENRRFNVRELRVGLGASVLLLACLAWAGPAVAQDGPMAPVQPVQPQAQKPAEAAAGSPAPAATNPSAGAGPAADAAQDSSANAGSWFLPARIFLWCSITPFPPAARALATRFISRACFP